MALIRLAYAADLPGPEEALKRLQSGEPVGGGSPPRSGRRQWRRRPDERGRSGSHGRACAQAEAAPTLQSFADVVALIDAKRDIALRLDVERFVRPVSFRVGAIEFEPAPGAPPT